MCYFIEQIFIFANVKLILHIEYILSVVTRNREVFLRKGVLKLCSEFTGEHPGWSAISIKLLCNSPEITLRHGCSPVNLLHISIIPFPRNISEGLLLDYIWFINVRYNKLLSTKKWHNFRKIMSSCSLNIELLLTQFLEFIWCILFSVINALIPDEG